MIKRTLYFGNPSYLSLANKQLIVKQPATKDENFTAKSEIKASIPIEDIGIVVLDNQQITISQGVINFLLQHNVALGWCPNATHSLARLLEFAKSAA